MTVAAQAVTTAGNSARAARVAGVAWLLVFTPVCGSSAGLPDGGVRDGLAAGGQAGLAGAGGHAGMAAPLPGTCPAPVAASDVSAPTTVVGTGTAASCTEAALDRALAAAGVITFDCGPDPHTIRLGAEKRITRPTVIDGKGIITLSGGGVTRLMAIVGDFGPNDARVTLQNLTIADGRAADRGCGVLRRGHGVLTLFQVTFRNNHCTQTGEDLAGGAVFSQEGHTFIVGCVFENNSAASGGAVGNLRSNLTIVNSRFVGNRATGRGGNPPSGGNGGAVSSDGLDIRRPAPFEICGSRFTMNQAGDNGGALFKFSYPGERTAIDRSTFDGNTAARQAGAIYHQASPLVLTNSTVSDNSAPHSGGLALFGPGNADLTNVTIVGNVATASLGGGLNAETGGTLKNVTIVKNEALFGGGIAGGRSLVLQNAIVAFNRHRNEWNNLNCADKLGGEGPNLQFPATRPNGSPEGPCSNGVVFRDPNLGGFGDHGGATPSVPLLPGSPAIGGGRACPPTDQRGRPRVGRCDLGAFQDDW